jgi:hypothetical protein
MTVVTQTSTTTQITKTSTGFIGPRHRAVTNDIAVFVLFCALSVLASFYVITGFPFSVEDATFLAAWL